jgi:hypothetical protein
LQDAAIFFIEQILLSRNADSYRVLGASRESSHAELRYHMALLMRWLHPDVVSEGASHACLGRSIYASRVTKAWEAVKTDERREVYDSSLPQLALGQRMGGLSYSSRREPGAPNGRAVQHSARALLRISPPRRGSLWTLIFIILGGRK